MLKLATNWEMVSETFERISSHSEVCIAYINKLNFIDPKFRLRVWIDPEGTAVDCFYESIFDSTEEAKIKAVEVLKQNGWMFDERFVNLM